MTEVATFFDQYGVREWERLEKDQISRMNFFLHMHFIEADLKPGMRILDAGCGAGRFSIELAKRGCSVTLLDISKEQLKIAKEKIELAGVSQQIEGYYEGDIRDLTRFQDEEFDLVLCYGAPLSYVMTNREKAIQEFHRVLKKDGMLYMSVNNRWGILKMLLGNQQPDFFNQPEYWMIQQVMETGDLPVHEKVSQPSRHFFEGEELRQLLLENQFHQIQLGASPCFTNGNGIELENLATDEKALETLLKIELATYTKPTMIDQGEFLLAKGRK